MRARSEKFFDHFSQARMFFQSQSEPEKDHIVEALRFELGKVERLPIRQRMVALLARVDHDLAGRVAEGLGFREIPALEEPINQSIPGDGDPADYQPRSFGSPAAESPALSMANTVKESSRPEGSRSSRPTASTARRSGASRRRCSREAREASSSLPGSARSTPTTAMRLMIDHSLLTAASVLFDAVYVPGGADSVAALIDRPGCPRLRGRGVPPLQAHRGFFRGSPAPRGESGRSSGFGGDGTETAAMPRPKACL